MATNFKYASQSDLKGYFYQYGDFDTKIQIFPTETSGSNHFFRDSGLVENFFVNGSEQASAQSNFDNVNGNGQWCYRSDNNDLKYQDSALSATTVNEQIFEAGLDFSTYIVQQLVNASLELNNLLDARFSTPLPKNTQADINSIIAGATLEYDPIIVKSTCYIAASNMIRSKNASDADADYFYNLVTNAEGTGIVDRLNAGKMKLSFEVDNLDSKGRIRTIDLNGTMNPVQLHGDFTGGHNGYDVLRITCTTGGAYGVAKCQVDYYGSDKIFGNSSFNNIVTGGLDSWSGMSGILIRFQGASMTVDDIWEIEVMTNVLEPTNTVTNTIQLHR